MDTGPSPFGEPFGDGGGGGGDGGETSADDVFGGAEVAEDTKAGKQKTVSASVEMRKKRVRKQLSIIGASRQSFLEPPQTNVSRIAFQRDLRPTGPD